LTFFANTKLKALFLLSTSGKIEKILFFIGGTVEIEKSEKIE